MKRRSPRTAMIAGPKGNPKATLRGAFQGILKGTQVARVLAAATLAGSVLALSACQSQSPIQTDVAYQPADGVAVDLGDVQIRDLVVIAGAKGDLGILSGMVVNKSTGPVTVTFRTGAGGGSAQAEIPAGKATRLSGADGATPVSLPAIAAAPGDMIKVIVSTATGGSPEVSVPVLLPTGYYATITQAPVPTSTP